MPDLTGIATELITVRAELERVELQRDLATGQRADARRLLEDARHAAEVLLFLEREHAGSGRDGHINEDDLLPLLHALQIKVQS